ncbi:MAG TPA: asparaginase [Chloroflexota bacterium]|nr:asparaginase [Chloroflexota bacterium]
MSARKPTAVIITTGGTIASRPDPVTGAVVPAVSGEDLVSAVPGLSHVANVEVRAYRNVLGPALEPEDLFAIGRMAVDALKQDAVDGVVVTSGTGIIEEGSYLCDLLNTTDKPLVWTGAQFSADMWDTDGPRNLLNSVRVAVDPEARGMGAVVCFNQEINAARDVIKHHKSNMHTFTSLDVGILGRADEDRVVFVRRPARRRAFDVARIEPNVDFIKIVAGSDDRFFRASIAAGAKGIVVESFPGVGILSPRTLPGALAAREAGIPVVLTTRSIQGRTIPKYGGEIGARDLIRHGIILAGDLAPSKAHVLLMVLLAVTQDNERLRELFADAAP